MAEVRLKLIFNFGFIVEVLLKRGLCASDRSRHPAQLAERIQAESAVPSDGLRADRSLYEGRRPNTINVQVR